jgi:hypothetical protein
LFWDSEFLEGEVRVGSNNSPRGKVNSLPHKVPSQPSFFSL